MLGALLFCIFQNLLALLYLISTFLFNTAQHQSTDDLQLYTSISTYTTLNVLSVLTPHQHHHSALQTDIYYNNRELIL